MEDLSSFFKDLKLRAFPVVLGLFFLVVGFLRSRDYDFGVFEYVVILLVFVVAIVIDIMFSAQVGTEKRKYWEENPPITVTGYVDDVIITYKRQLSDKIQGGYEYYNNIKSYYVISFIDTTGTTQYHLLRSYVKVKKAVNNIGKPITFQYIEDDYQGEPQLVLSQGIFMGEWYSNLVGITEDMTGMNIVVKLPDGTETKDAFKIFSAKYHGEPIDYGPSILGNKNSRITPKRRFWSLVAMDDYF